MTSTYRVNREISIGRSKIHELGVFPNRTFANGEAITQLTGRIIHWSQLPPFDTTNTARFIQIGPLHYLDSDTGGFLNHSCKPSAGIRIKELGGKRFEVELIAIRPIRKGEEITYDYSTTMNEGWDPYPYRLMCRCGEDNCRGVIGDFKDVPEIFRLGYIGFGVVPAYAQSGAVPEELKRQRR